MRIKIVFMIIDFLCLGEGSNVNTNNDWWFKINVEVFYLGFPVLKEMKKKMLLQLSNKYWRGEVGLMIGSWLSYVQFLRLILVSYPLTCFSLQLPFLHKGKTREKGQKN